MSRGRDGLGPKCPVTVHTDTFLISQTEWTGSGRAVHVEEK